MTYKAVHNCIFFTLPPLRPTHTHTQTLSPAATCTPCTQPPIKMPSHDCTLCTLWLTGLDHWSSGQATDPTGGRSSPSFKATELAGSRFLPTSQQHGCQRKQLQVEDLPKVQERQFSQTFVKSSQFFCFNVQKN